MVESQPSKLLVAGSSPVSRSKKQKVAILSFFCLKADVAQLVEHILGKDEVTGSIPVVSSILMKESHERHHKLRVHRVQA